MTIILQETESPEHQILFSLLQSLGMFSIPFMVSFGLIGIKKLNNFIEEEFSTDAMTVAVVIEVIVLLGFITYCIIKLFDL